MGRVLLGSGSNELMRRPHDREQWNDAVKGGHGKVVRMHLAGNVVVPNVINKYGNVVVKTTPKLKTLTLLG